MERDAPGQVPGVNDTELIAALRDLASIPETSADSAERFGFEVHAIVEHRAQLNWAAEGDSDVAVFLHTLYPREVGGKLGGTPISNLIANGYPVLGKLFLLNPDASWGRVIDLPVEADQIIDWLIEKDLGDQPLVFVYRGNKRFLLRGRGAKGEITRKETIRDRPPAVTLQSIGEALTYSHQQHLITPSICPPDVWAKGRAHEYIPGSHPEKAIQRQLGTDLRAWFHGTVRAEFEEPVPLGRIDIRLSNLQDGRWTFWAILELKVLRSSHHAGEGQKASPVALKDNVEAVVEGVRQVHTFAKDCRAEPLLEIFDLRKTKHPSVTDETPVALELRKCQPVLNYRVWPLFGSAGDARRAALQ